MWSGRGFSKLFSKLSGSLSFSINSTGGLGRKESETRELNPGTQPAGHFPSVERAPHHTLLRSVVENGTGQGVGAGDGGVTLAGCLKWLPREMQAQEMQGAQGVRAPVVAAVAFAREG